ncbi:Uncharacterised protein [uncultured archaeon]|nr:Uncharacterised protein [uncultured archaeon]
MENQLKRMDKRAKTTTITLLILATLTSTAHAATLTLGSITDISRLTIPAGGDGTFQASFFTLESTPVEITFNVEAPPEVMVRIDPQNITITSNSTDWPNEGGSWYVLSDTGTYIRTYPVKVRVRIPSILTQNGYKIKLTAIAKNARSASAPGIQQKVAQSREITFYAYTPGPIEGFPTTNDQNTQNSGTTGTETGPYIPASDRSTDQGGQANSPSGNYPNNPANPINTGDTNNQNTGNNNPTGNNQQNTQTTTKQQQNNQQTHTTTKTPTADIIDATKPPKTTSSPLITIAAIAILAAIALVIAYVIHAKWKK